MTRPRHKSRPADQALTLTPIAITHSCFKDKFGVPRQSGLTRHAHAELLIQRLESADPEMTEIARGLLKVLSPVSQE